MKFDVSKNYKNMDIISQIKLESQINDFDVVKEYLKFNGDHKKTIALVNDTAQSLMDNTPSNNQKDLIQAKLDFLNNNLEIASSEARDNGFLNRELIKSIQVATMDMDEAKHGYSYRPNDISEDVELIRKTSINERISEIRNEINSSIDGKLDLNPLDREIEKKSAWEGHLSNYQNMSNDALDRSNSGENAFAVNYKLAAYYDVFSSQLEKEVNITNENIHVMQNGGPSKGYLTEDNLDDNKAYIEKGLSNIDEKFGAGTAEAIDMKESYLDTEAKFHIQRSKELSEEIYEMREKGTGTELSHTDELRRRQGIHDLSANYSNERLTGVYQEKVDLDNKEREIFKEPASSPMEKLRAQEQELDNEMNKYLEKESGLKLELKYTDSHLSKIEINQELEEITNQIENIKTKKQEIKSDAEKDTLYGAEPKSPFESQYPEEAALMKERRLDVPRENTNKGPSMEI